VLSVAVHEQGPLESFLHGHDQTRSHGRALSKISGMGNDHRTGVCRQLGSVVPRTVVHDHDVRDVAANRLNQRSNDLPLVQTRNNGDVISKPIHNASLLDCR
jgi:hypothetical protein